MFSRRTFLSAIAGGVAAPGLSFAQGVAQPGTAAPAAAQPGAAQKAALYANVGADLTHYEVDVAGAELIKRETV
jgi:6-phosphogluconolactonase